MRLHRCVCLILSLHFCAAFGQVPSLLHYQGRILVGSTAFEGLGQFKFSVVNFDGSQTFWRNAPDGNSDGQPDGAVSLAVTQGLYSVFLGDTALPNMAALPPTAFAGDVYLRVWFNDGVSGFQQLAPDQRIGSVAYALVAATVPDGSLTAAKFAPGALTAAAQASGSVVASDSAADAALQTAGFQIISSLAAPSWNTSAAPDAPSPRHAHAGIWSQGHAQFFVWGGQVSAGVYSGSGATYQPASDEWQAVTSVGAPSARRGHTLALDATGRALIWGGFNEAGFLNTGAKFNFATRSWSALADLNAPSPRDLHVSLTTGPFMFVWGGRNGAGPLNDGALYHSANDQWIALNLSGAPAARSGAAAVWTGDKVLIWGGNGASGVLGAGAQLRFQTTPTFTPMEWTPMQTTGAPAARVEHTAVWTGTRMIIWGGRNGSTFFADGASFDPATDTWAALPAMDAPSARAAHTAVWTGTEMVVFGGETAAGSTASGAAYNPVSNRWRPLQHGGTPVARSGAVGGWTGTELILFGGLSSGNPVAALQRVLPQPTWYLYRKP